MRNVIWTAVVAAVLLVGALICALVGVPGSVVHVLSAAAVVAAILSLRE